jgi:hypothetical protein
MPLPGLETANAAVEDNANSEVELRQVRGWSATLPQPGYVKVARDPGEIAGRGPGSIGQPQDKRDLKLDVDGPL